MHFPQQFNELFEPYENHCIFEFQNLQSLDDAMNNADFNTYIKVIYDVHLFSVVLSTKTAVLRCIAVVPVFS